MKKLVVILVGCFCLVTTTAFAGSYFSTSLGTFTPSKSDVTGPLLTSNGVASMELSYDTGCTASLALGRDLDILRVEGEFSYKVAQTKKASVTLTGGASGTGSIGGNIRSSSLMANIWKDIKVGPVTPYIGGGLGAAKVDGKLEHSESDTVFAYQVGLGIGVPIAENLIFDISYRYFATSDLDFDGAKLDFASNNVMAGLKVNY